MRGALLLAMVLVPSSLLAQAPERTGEYVKTHYQRTDVRIVMRDGVRLHTVVYAPKDTSQRYPILMTRTPYGVHPYEKDKYRSSLGPNAHFLSEKFIFVYQDVRGRYMSEGVFENVRPQRTRYETARDIDESTDTFDSIEWLVRNLANHNGKVGLWGISYPGFYSAAGMINAHPALKAVSPQAPIADWFFDDFIHHGAFFQVHAFNFFSFFGYPRPEPTTVRGESFKYPTQDGYRFYLEAGSAHDLGAKYFKGQVPYWDVLAEHPNRDDFWKARNLLPHLKKVAPAVLTVGGWYDAEDLYGTFKTYRAIENQNPGIDNRLVIGPWVHGGWERADGSKLGPISFGSNTSAFYQKEIELPFFNHHLKGKGPQSLPEAYVFETGANRWRKFDQWPPAESRSMKLYLNAGFELGGPPVGKVRLDGRPELERDASDAFLSDPRKPVPFIDAQVTTMATTYMVEDQRFAWRRPDVLSYQTAPFTSDFTAAGPLTARLSVSTTGTDADWVVKLIDVYPDSSKAASDGRSLAGMQRMVRSEVIRGRFRDSYEKPTPFVPNEPAVVTLELQDVLHTFRPGHRLMVQICSTWFPLVDRNPQTFVPNVFRATERDYQPAMHRVHRSVERSSWVELGVLPATTGGVR